MKTEKNVQRVSVQVSLGRVNEKVADLQRQDQHIQDILDLDSEILTSILFGVDANSESIEIPKLWLWIETAGRGKVMDSLSGNPTIITAAIGHVPAASLLPTPIHPCRFVMPHSF